MINTNWMMSQILLKEGEKQGLQAQMISKEVIKKQDLLEIV